VAAQITNKMLSQLLLDLGFERGEETEKKNCVWHHPEAGTKLVLAANKVDEEALQLDTHPLRMKLELNGHLDAATFDAFLAEGRLPQVS